MTGLGRAAQPCHATCPRKPKPQPWMHNAPAQPKRWQQGLARTPKPPNRETLCSQVLGCPGAPPPHHPSAHGAQAPTRQHLDDILKRHAPLHRHGVGGGQRCSQALHQLQRAAWRKESATAWLTGRTTAWLTGRTAARLPPGCLQMPQLCRPCRSRCGPAAAARHQRGAEWWCEQGSVSWDQWWCAHLRPCRSSCSGSAPPASSAAMVEVCM